MAKRQPSDPIARVYENGEHVVDVVSERLLHEFDESSTYDVEMVEEQQKLVTDGGKVADEIKQYEVTVKKGEHGETLDVIDIQASSEPDAHRKVRNRDDVFDVMPGCTVEYRVAEAGGKIY